MTISQVVSCIRSSALVLLTALVNVDASPAYGQLVTSPSSVPGPFNSPDTFVTNAFVNEAWSSSTGIAASSSTSLTAAYQWFAAADAGSGGTAEGAGVVDWYVLFKVQAPVGYEMRFDFTSIGAMTTLDEGAVAADCHFEEFATTPFFRSEGGNGTEVVVQGALSLPLHAISSADTTGYQDIPIFEPQSTMVIRGLSNGSEIQHIYRFAWFASCLSTVLIGNADEAALRFGMPTSDWSTGESASDYPGQGGRNRAGDGMFLTVTVRALCGDGVLDGSTGEQCDAGAANGTPGSCCTSTCQFKTAGTPCRPVAGPCDVAESCPGNQGVCPADGFAAGTLCRTAASPCDGVELCTGGGPTCPADLPAPFGTVCRPAVGPCDVAEQCNGVSFGCPGNTVLPDVDGDSFCDAIDNCPVDSNPDQRDTDSFSGGDVCDQCPSVEPNFPPFCDPNRSGGKSIDQTGGTLSKGNVTLTVPPNAVGGPTSFGITTRPSSSRYGLGSVGGNLVSVADLSPEGVTFAQEVTVEITWPDAQAPLGVVDGTNTAEALLQVWRTPPGSGVPVAVTQACAVQSCPTGCEAGTFTTAADCCCAPINNSANKWILKRTQFSEYAMGESCPPVSDARLKLAKLDTPPGDDVLSFKGSFTLPPGTPTADLDPLVNGIQLILDTPGGQMLDLTIPPGPLTPSRGWKVNAAGTKWNYRDKTLAPLGGITRVVVQDKSSTAPGLIKFRFKGKGGSYAATPLVGRSLVLPAHGDCFRFDFEQGQSCTVSRSGAAVNCVDASSTVPTITTTTTTSTTTTTTPSCPPGDLSCCALPGVFGLYSTCAIVTGLSSADANATCSAAGGSLSPFGCPGACPTFPQVGCCLFGASAPAPYTCGRYDAAGVDVFGTVESNCTLNGGTFLAGLTCP